MWALKIKFNKYCNERKVSLIIVRFEQVTEIRDKESYNIMYVLMLDEKTIRMVLNFFWIFPEKMFKYNMILYKLLGVHRFFDA